MKKGQIYEGVVEYVAFPNKGVLKVEDEKVVVKHTIAGQKVSFSISKKRKGKCEGRLLEVLEKSPVEVESPCPHYGICGGCEFQTLPYEEQLKMKEAQVRALLEPVCPEIPFEGIVPSPVHSEYRNKMEFSFGDAYKGGPLSLGMHKRGSFYDIVEVDQCKIVDEDFRAVLTMTLEHFREAGVPFFQKMRHEGYLRHLLVRKAVKTQQILVDLVTSTQMEVDLQPWVDKLLALPLKGSFAGILHTKNDSLADVVQDQGTDILYGQDFFYEELLGLRFKISPFSFFQTNSLGAEVLYSKAREYIGDTKDQVVFDLYSGTGTIAQILAPVAKKVVGVEIIEEAVEAAKVNAQLNGLSNCEFLAGDVLKVLDTIEEKPDFIVLDPPRDGIHPKALDKIIDYGVDRMIYISCKPTSLARDLVVLQERDYQVDRCCCVDMFPNTGNVETVAILSKK
ncbi:MAG: 23S rRNA (uracil(1939)-C(5))-methyltransferase RlmD [Lachnospiraceae bacterium]|nr:23S rRNA (uracil(1939)-C(5))-methyltransferase RlmD [Lachnospiraceae bacterium]